MTTHIVAAAAVGLPVAVAPSSFAAATLAFKAASLQFKTTIQIPDDTPGYDEAAADKQIHEMTVELQASMLRLAQAQPTSQAELTDGLKAVSAYFDDPVLHDPEARLWPEEIELLTSTIRKASSPR